MKNFTIGKEINRLLTEGSVEGVTNKIFPLIANPNTTFPFLTYRRIGYSPQSTKDYIGEIVVMELNICSETYEESVDIANSACDILVGNPVSEIIEEIKLANVSEMFLQDTYIQNVQLQIELK